MLARVLVAAPAVAVADPAPSRRPKSPLPPRLPRPPRRARLRPADPAAPSPAGSRMSHTVSLLPHARHNLALTSSLLLVQGDQVTFNGFLWTASQWNFDETPGGASGAWTKTGPCATTKATRVKPSLTDEVPNPAATEAVVGRRDVFRFKRSY